MGLGHRGSITRETKLILSTHSRAETPRMTPTPTPLAIPVKRLLRTQGISPIREKSENDNLCILMHVSRNMRTRSAGLPLSLHEHRSTYLQQSQCFRRTPASPEWSTWAWKEFPSLEWRTDIFPRFTTFSQKPCQHDEQHYGYNSSMQRPGLANSRNRTPALHLRYFSTGSPLSGNRSNALGPVLTEDLVR
jgi:hypothetical protein